MHALGQDLRRALRALRSRPGGVAISVLTRALGMGVTTAMFSVVDALMLRRFRGSRNAGVRYACDVGGAEPATRPVVQVSAGMLPMLGVYPQLGRPLTAADATSKQGRVLLLSHRLWRDAFGKLQRRRRLRVWSCERERCLRSSARHSASPERE